MNDKLHSIISISCSSALCNINTCEWHQLSYWQALRYLQCTWLSVRSGLDIICKWYIYFFAEYLTGRDSYIIIQLSCFCPIRPDLVPIGCIQRTSRIYFQFSWFTFIFMRLDGPKPEANIFKILPWKSCYFYFLLIMTSDSLHMPTNKLENFHFERTREKINCVRSFLAGLCCCHLLKLKCSQSAYTRAGWLHSFTGSLLGDGDWGS